MKVRKRAFFERRPGREGEGVVTEVEEEVADGHAHDCGRRIRRMSDAVVDSTGDDEEYAKQQE